MPDMPIYLDHAATTPVDPEVLDFMMPFFRERFGSATTLYSLGRDGGEVVEEARVRVAELIGAKPEEVVFTSGGSESDNWAIFGVTASAVKKGRHIITTAIEHHAVLEPYHLLEKQGYEVTILPVDECGLVSVDQLESAVRDDTVLISIMHANNEVGTIEPVEEIGKIAKARGIHFHVDAVQTVGHIPVDVNLINCDSMAMSAHKLYGPKGVGACYVRKGARMARFMYGGAQEKNRRAGTHNVPGIAGFGKAAELAAARLTEEVERETAIRDALIDGIIERIPEAKLNGHRAKRLPNNVNFSFKGVEGESMILLMDMNGMCVSSGSACTSGSLDPSHVLMALGLPHEIAHGSLRMTLGRDNTEAHVSRVLDVLPRIVERLREMSPIYGADMGG